MGSYTRTPFKSYVRGFTTLSVGSITATGNITAQGQFLAKDGTAGSPGFAFAASPTYGFFNEPGGSRFAATAGNSEAMYWGNASNHNYKFFSNAGSIQMNSGAKLILDPSNSATDCPLQFGTDANTGLRWNSADNMSFIVGGSENLIVVGAGINATQIINTGALYQREMTIPAASTDYAAIYAVVDGGSKTDLMVRFQTGAAQGPVAQEP